MGSGTAQQITGPESGHLPGLAIDRQAPALSTLLGQEDDHDGP